MYLGLDLGTSAVKAILMDADGALVAQASAPLPVSRPRPGWSEQDPEHWCEAADAAVGSLAREHARELSAVEGVGLSGQMHGATLLDARDRPLRPCILWNDGRSSSECTALMESGTDFAGIAGNIAMPGFTAPKLLWVQRHEPEAFARLRRILLPKDYLRLVLTGEAVSDMSDAAGTLWLDVGKREWSSALLAATGLDESSMPSLTEGSEISGGLRSEVADRWGVAAGVPVAGGGGDNAAGAVGAGVVAAGDAFLSLGTSGVIFAVSDGFRPHPAQGLHAFCHALPDRWHQMAVILSAASCVSWACGLLGYADEREIEAAVETVAPGAEMPLFLPYLAGERTPHNDATARGVFFGLSQDTGPSDLAYAVFEGVAFALADGLDVMRAAGTDPERLAVIGGGARSVAWRRILSAALGRPLVYARYADVGPALGAARLAAMAATGQGAESLASPFPEEHVEIPDAGRVERLAARRLQFDALYPALDQLFDAFTNDGVAA